MEAALTAALKANAALTALVGGAAAPRIHWDKLPARKAVPALILHQVASGPVQHTMRGRVPTTEWVVQFDGWGGTKADSIAVREAVLAVLDALKAAPLMAFPDSFHSDWTAAEGPDADGSTDLYRASIDARIWHFPTA
ncbi:MAG: tail completion protein gp17 [Pseudomonadota bacterium]